MRPIKKVSSEETGHTTGTEHLVSNDTSPSRPGPASTQLMVPMTCREARGPCLCGDRQGSTLEYGP